MLIGQVCYLPNHLNYSNPDTRNKRDWTFRNECPALFYVKKFGGIRKMTYLCIYIHYYK